MKPCVAGVVTILVAAYFWVQWWSELEIHVEQVRTITVMLEQQNLTRVGVWPKGRDGDLVCYSWSAIKNDYQTVGGEVCL